MKKVFILLAAMFVAMVGNAQTIVEWSVNDTNMGHVEVIHPVAHYETDTLVDTVYQYTYNYDSIISIDTIFDTNGIVDHFDTVYFYELDTVVDSLIVLDTFYNENEWFMLAVPNDSVMFGYWVNNYISNDSSAIDTVYSDVNLIDITDCVFDTVKSTAYFLQVNSIKQAKSNGKLSVYPNPTSDIVYFKNIVKEYYVYDANGRGVVCGVNARMVDLSHYTSGIYIIKTNVGTVKILKK